MSLFSQSDLWACARAGAVRCKTEFEVVEDRSGIHGGQGDTQGRGHSLQQRQGRGEHAACSSLSRTKPTSRFRPLMKHSFNNTQSRRFRCDRAVPGRLRNGWPLGEFFDRGYGFVAVYQQDLVGHNEVEFLNGIQSNCSTPKGQSFPRRTSGACSRPCAWGAMRAHGLSRNRR